MVTMHRDSDMVKIKNREHIRAALYINNKGKNAGPRIVASKRQQG